MAKPRSIFEEVGDSAGARREVATGIIDRGGAGGARRWLRAWLILTGLWVVAAMLVDGIARLSDSGFAIADWRAAMGLLPLLPPGTEAEWQLAFGAYQQTAEFGAVNSTMELSDFKGLFQWEWAQRLLDLAAGLVWLSGFLGFWVAGKIPGGWVPRLLTIGALLGLLIAGPVATGWVVSGAESAAWVTPYRLAFDLGLAFASLGLIAWAVFRLGFAQADLLQARRLRDGALWGMGTALMHLTFVQLLFGALLAGIDAGRGYTDWPLMAGQLFPPYAFELEPLWRNLFENAGLVQFIHRLLGYLVALLALAAMLRARKATASATRRAFLLAGLVVLLQLGLGILTVLNGAFLHVAITHQLCAVLAWVLILNARFHAGYPQPQSLRG